MSGAWQHPPGHFPRLREFWVQEMGGLMQDAILLARARGGRNKPCSRPHALRLTLLVDFADEDYPKAGRDLDEIRPRPGRFLSEVWPRF
jgi:hypothetical protein